MSTRLLIENENGEQSVVCIDRTKGGKVGIGTTIIWDEDTDGAIPAMSDDDMGGYSKSGNALAVDNDKKAPQQLKRTKLATRISKRSDAINLLKTTYKDAGTSNEMKAIIFLLAQELSE